MHRSQMRNLLFQNIISMAFTGWESMHKQTIEKKRYEGQRLDRTGWHGGPLPASYADAHIPQRGYAGDWGGVRNLLVALLPKDSPLVALADKYREEFAKVVK
jgi:hypothetical protein